MILTYNMNLTTNITFPHAYQVNDTCAIQSLLQNVSNGTSISYFYLIIIMIIVIFTIKADIKFIRNVINGIKVFLKLEAENNSLESIESNC
jgi:hypothetical protein